MDSNCLQKMVSDTEFYNQPIKQMKDKISALQTYLKILTFYAPSLGTFLTNDIPRGWG